ncbi:Protein of unknown function [Pyronema omphalodes CBS 100304]|uniref:Uncharacterized protein n=1 Tax=Pyronema omphalodes (strain CBS 100304) TaxID=1076935 RepID=U4LNP6_PYROM|nr:Protein of unknown function [Pyronema omphalodes CBS 100304]
MSNVAFELWKTRHKNHRNLDNCQSVPARHAATLDNHVYPVAPTFSTLGHSEQSSLRCSTNLATFATLFSSLPGYNPLLDICQD